MDAESAVPPVFQGTSEWFEAEPHQDDPPWVRWAIRWARTTGANAAEAGLWTVAFVTGRRAR